MCDYRSHSYPDGQVDILLVEANLNDARLTHEAFKSAESERTLHHVTTGDEALEFLTQQATDGSVSLPDLVLLDLNLPGKDGCEVLKTVRETPQLRGLPVMMLTSSEAEADIAACYDAHANAYLTKPRDHDAFVSMVKTVDRF